MQNKSWNNFVLPSLVNLSLVLLAFSSLVIDLLICLQIMKPSAPFNNHETIITGSVLFIAGTAGTLISRFGFLKKSWSTLIKIFPKKNMICHGPYSIIRHPIYFFALFFYSSSLLLFPTLLNSIFVILILIGYIVLTKIEDDYLRANLDFYQKYTQHVRFRLIPGIW